MEIKERIINGATDLFTKNGIKTVTMDLISTSLGVSKRTIYEIFKDKEELVHDVIKNAADYHKNHCFKIVEESENVIEAIFKIGEFNHQTFTKVNPLFISDLKKYHFKTFSKIVEKGDVRDMKLTYTLLERGLKEGLFKKSLDINIANNFIHEIFRIIHEEPFINYKRETIYESIFLPYWIGISTKKGQIIIEENIAKIQKNI
jgi:TetR/AcrR family transcriptional regulator, cholesterol catabolism regulator